MTLNNHTKCTTGELR